MRKLVAVGLIAAVVTSPWWLGVARNVMRRTLLLTTADPDVLGQFASTSMEPMAVRLHTRRPEQARVVGPMGERTEFTGRTIDEAIVFRAARAYFSVLDLKAGPTGPQRVGFSVWSEKFDPVRPYLIDALDQPKAPPGTSKLDRRIRETGEYILDFEISNFRIIDSVEEQRILTTIATRNGDKPCDRQLDPGLRMTVVTVPDGVAAADSCLGTTFANAAIYTKDAEGGGIKFVANCSGTGARGAPLNERCPLTGFFRGWPLHVWAPAQHVKTWDASFERIQEFLARISPAQS